MSIFNTGLGLAGDIAGAYNRVDDSDIEAERRRIES